MDGSRGGVPSRGRALAIARDVECDLMSIPKARHIDLIATKDASDKPP